MSSTETQEAPVKKDRTHFLYIAVIVAVVLGIIVGIVAPEFAVSLKWIGVTFVALVKMMIQPVIFCTLVIGVGSVRNAASVGKVGGLALAYFLSMSTIALAIGLVVGNLIDPGEGLNLTDETAKAGSEQAAGAGSTTEFITGIVPDSLFSSLTSGEVLQTLFVALLVGFALQAMGSKGQPILTGIGHLQRLVFRVLSMVMWAAPVGAFGAIAAVVGETGLDALKSLAVLMIAFYLTCFICLRRARHDPQAGHGCEHLPAVQVPRPRVPADPLDLVLGVGAAAGDRQDGARRGREDHGRRGDPDGLLLQPRRHRDLPDDGLHLHRRRPGQAPRDRRADLAAGLHGDRVQGAAGVSGAGLAMLAGGLSSHRPELLDGVGLIVGIDRFMSEARALTNFAGNGVATVLVGHWTGTMNRDRLDTVLAGDLPFDERTMLDDDEADASPPELEPSAR